MKWNCRNKTYKGLKIINVLPNSIARKKKIVPKDCLLSINNSPINDLIDYHFHSADEKLSITLKSITGKIRKVKIEKEHNEDVGIILEEIKPRKCSNKCIFCFIHQMPKGLRKSLYVKDEDYRLSFLHGNFITATDLSEEDFQRIINLHLSPIYLSVHTTNPPLREFMLGRKGIPDILNVIKRLIDNNVVIHTQIVLCPEINDGIELEKTLNELSQFYPRLQSIAIVPVGLTKHRENLFPLKKITLQYARNLIAKIKIIQNQCKKTYGKNFTFLADEFYLLADEPFPSFQHYGDFPQFENGVGMVVTFMRKFDRIKKRLPEKINQKKKVGIITSTLSDKFLKPALSSLRNIQNLQIKIIPVKNNLFGDTVTVTGLLSGKDILQAIESNAKCDHYIIPGNALKTDEFSFSTKEEGCESCKFIKRDELDKNVFLDDMTLGELKNKVKNPISVVYYDIKELIDAILFV